MEGAIRLSYPEGTSFLHNVKSYAELVEGFDRIKTAHQKTKAELAHLNVSLAEEMRVAKERELELLIA